METRTMTYAPPPPPRMLDPANGAEYAERLREGLQRALIDAGRDELGGATVVRAQTVVAELIRVMAYAVHSSPDMAVPSRCRRWCDEFAKELRREIGNVQRAAAAGELGEVMYADDATMEWPK